MTIPSFLQYHVSRYNPMHLVNPFQIIYMYYLRDGSGVIGFCLHL